MTKHHSGSCLCEGVRFELAGAFDAFFFCYCKRCQKDTGSAHAANLFSSSGKLTWLQGKESVNTFQLPDTRHCRSFCQHCGSALPTEARELGVVVVPAGSLDTPVDIAPKAKIFVASAADWSKDITDVASFEALPE